MTNMSKIKTIVIWLVGYLVGLAMLVKPAYAVTVDIVDLSDYITTNNFKLSCTALGGTSAQFSFKKEGGSYSDFGSAIDLTTTSCQVQVTSSQVEEQTRYYFKVTVDSVSDETDTFYDISGPSPVSNYYKDQISGGYKLHWKNPGDSDFAKVKIYRGETADFSADGSHSIAEVAGGANSDMTYDDHTPDPNKTYYYAIRALDKAGNSSSLVGDAGTTVTGTVQGTSTASSGTEGKVSTLHKEGEVLSKATEEATATQIGIGAESKKIWDTNPILFFITHRKKLTLLIAAIVFGLPALIIYLRKKNK